MNRASKIHWKNLSLTLNGRNSETKNDKNNPKVPKFSSCRGLSSTLSRKCGWTTLCGCFWVFVGVGGVTICDYLAQTCPWDYLARRKKKICCLIKNDREAATFVNLIFRNLDWNDNVKSFFLHCGDELNGLGPSWMALTHGNVIFDILEHSAFQKYSICWVFRSLSCSTSFSM